MHRVLLWSETNQQDHGTLAGSTTLSTTLYEIDVCMKLLNMASPKFGEWGGINMQSMEAAQVSTVIVGSTKW
jgi:hypothetical protein